MRRIEWILVQRPQTNEYLAKAKAAPALCAGILCVYSYARRMGQPTQRATNYTARSNIDPAQTFLHANGQSAPPRSVGARRGEPHTEHGLGVFLERKSLCRVVVLFLNTSSGSRSAPAVCALVPCACSPV